MFCLSLPIGLSYYDSNTRAELLRTVSQQLQPGASIKQMTDFMQRHTARYSFDNKHRHEFTGILPQTRLDVMLFDRKVQLILRESKDHTFLDADVRVYYTGL